MRSNPIPGGTNDAQDGAAEAATLDRVLWLHPTHLTEPELLLNLYAGDGDEREEMFERAIRDLVAGGPPANRRRRGTDPTRSSASPPRNGPGFSGPGSPGVMENGLLTYMTRILDQEMRIY